MSWRKPRCKHPRVRFHTFKKYVPDNLYIVGACLECGVQREVKIGFVSEGSRLQVASEVLAAKGWRQSPGDPNVFEREAS